jgi:hypothetical protein
LNVSVADAKSAALELWSAWAGSSVVSGLGVNAAALRVAVEAIADARKLLDGRKDETGKPRDFVAPSAWHAACCLLFATIHNRRSKLSFEDPDAFRFYYGHRGVFRGQARPWLIEPTGWRTEFPTASGVAAVGAYLTAVTGQDDAPEFDLLGRIRSESDATALCQHYGMPTSLVDFTFDPLAAVFFALSPTASQNSSQDGLSDHAIVYTAPLARLAEFKKIGVAFPPIQSSRLFRQSGLFIDCGPKHATGAEAATEVGGTSLDEVCSRCYFPREYPVDSEFEALKHRYLTSEPFFEELVQLSSVFALSESGSNPLDYLKANLTKRPPWLVGILDGGGVYTDDWFLDNVGRLIERYLTFSALVNCTDGPRFDPLMLNLFAQKDDRILNAIRDLSALKGTSLSALSPIAAEIVRSSSALQGFRDLLERENSM